MFQQHFTGNSGRPKYTTTATTQISALQGSGDGRRHHMPKINPVLVTRSCSPVGRVGVFGGGSGKRSRGRGSSGFGHTNAPPDRGDQHTGGIGDRIMDRKLLRDSEGGGNL